MAGEYQNSKPLGRGGPGRGQGRPKGSRNKKIQLKAILAGDQGFFIGVLNRLRTGRRPKSIRSAEDLAVSLLWSKNPQIQAHAFHTYLAYIYGKPPQAIFHADTREASSALPLGDDFPEPANEPKAAEDLDLNTAAELPTERPIAACAETVGKDAEDLNPAAELPRRALAQGQQRRNQRRGRRWRPGASVI